MINSIFSASGLSLQLGGVWYWVVNLACPLLSLVLFSAGVLVYYIGVSKNSLNTAALLGIFFEIEGETSSTTDTKLLVDQVVLSATFFTMVGLILFNYPTVIVCPATINTITWAVYIVSAPTAAAVIFGSYILNYLKGDSGSNSLLYGGIFDLAALFGFFTRFIVQTIRYAMVYIKMCLYVICMEDTVVRDIRIERITGAYDRPRTLISRFCDDIFWSIRHVYHVLFDIFNVIIIHYTQLGALTLVLCWLLKSLYSHAHPIVTQIWLNRTGKWSDK